MKNESASRQQRRSVRPHNKMKMSRIPPEQRDIIIFGDDWERHPQTLEHLAKSWAVRHRIIWVNSLGHKRLEFSWKYIQRLVEKIRTATRPSQPRPDGITVVRPLTIPFHQFRAVRRLNGWLVERLIRRHMDRLGFARPLLLTNSPATVGAVGRLGESVVAYYCVDDYPAFPDAFDTMADVERELLAKSDIAFFVSEKLLRERAPRPPHVFTMTQGVHDQHFSAIPSSPDPAVTGIPHPIIGFMGWLTHWVDLNLIHAVALRRPEWSFVWVGSSAVDLRPYAGTSNMHFLGPRSYGDLPATARSFDVGLIPFKLNDLTLASNPLKLLEYFAMGIPVVSTPLPEVERHRPWVLIASGVEQTERAIERALTQKGPSARARRVEIARRHSWDHLAESQLHDILRAESDRRVRSGFVG